MRTFSPKRRRRTSIDQSHGIAQDFMINASAAFMSTGSLFDKEIQSVSNARLRPPPLSGRKFPLFASKSLFSLRLLRPLRRVRLCGIIRTPEIVCIYSYTSAIVLFHSHSSMVEIPVVEQVKGRDFSLSSMMMMMFGSVRCSSFSFNAHALTFEN